jgi:hypothetical protein
VFSWQDRERLRNELVSTAEADPCIIAAAQLGSGAVGQEDEWSDVDLALCLAPDADRAAVIADWTERMYTGHSAVHHLDVYGNEALYRVFLLATTLQVDVSFWPASRFKPAGPKFRLLFGEAGEATHRPTAVADELIGAGWLYALHGRSSIARGRLWQAEYMISLARDQVLALACLRHGLPANEARAIDDLPAEAIGGLATALVGSLDAEVLSRALKVTVDALLGEADAADPQLAKRLATPLTEIGGHAAN